MRIYLLAVAGLSLALATPAAAQSIKKVGAEIHHTLKSAGNTVKHDAGEVGSATHRTLQKAGNDTKAQLGRTTGVHKVGGTVGEAAQDVSRTGKSVGRNAKHSLKKSSSAAHHELKKTGNEAKGAIKP